jgi:drug/metabolite transporter (DMT)-like permease
VAYVLVRKLNATEDSSVIIFYFPIMALPLSLLMLGDDIMMPQGWAWLSLLLVGIATQVGQVGLTKAMKTATASKATSFSYLQIIFAMVFGIIFFDEIPTLWTVIGAILIMLGVIINALPSSKKVA